uniref:hypothetical protein n=1 Tax=Pseudofabraea citricarpa TaxID=1664388 RepID=UPI0022FD851B|nr:hypothetical protein PN052_mgp13 [Pseudofabraea citricarpa]WAX38814.1 ribosomal protein S3 [Pseudofabraea citricarpa]
MIVLSKKKIIRQKRMKNNEDLNVRLFKDNQSNLGVNTPIIFSKKLNNKSRVIPLNIIRDKMGPTKHFTPAAQEWVNNVYAYNKNYTKLLPSADKNLMELVKSYFNLYIQKYLNNEIEQSKGLPTRYRRLSIKKVFVGKGDIKHTSTKVIITLYVYNYEKRKFLAKEAKDIRNWFKEDKLTFNEDKPVVKIVNNNVFLSYKRWFNWTAYSLLQRTEPVVLEQFYLRKFFNKLSIKTKISKANLSLKEERESALAITNKGLFIYVPLYSDYIKYISSLNIDKNKPSFDNFINLIRIVKTKNLVDLKYNNKDFSDKALYLNHVKDYLSEFFVVNKKLTKVILNLKKLKTLKDPLGWNFKFRNLKRRYLILKHKTFSYNGKEEESLKEEMKSFTIHKFFYILSNINIKSKIDLSSQKKRRDVNLRDITLYLYHVNKYLNKNLHLVHKDFLFKLLDSLFEFKRNNLNYSENAIYIDYYKYLFSGEFVNKPSFDDFLTLLDNFDDADQLELLKAKYGYFSLIKNRNLKGKISKQITQNINKADIVKYSSEDFYNKALNFKEETLKHYFKLSFMSLRKLIFNQNKFTNSFMKNLRRLVNKLYNKEVVFNLVDLTKLHFNSDIYTQAVTLKLKNRKNRLYRVLKRSLLRVKIPYVNRIKEKGSKIDIEQFLVNKVKNIKINSILVNYINKKDPLNNLLLNFYPKNENIKTNSLEPEYWDKQWQEKPEYVISEYPILRTLKHKNLAGVRIEAKGRLSRRFTASRSVFKLKWIGGLKNVDSSFKKWSTVILRGHAKSNVLYSNVNSKNRIGAYGVKGWVSSK